MRPFQRALIISLLFQSVNVLANNTKSSPTKKPLIILAWFPESLSTVSVTIFEFILTVSTKLSISFQSQDVRLLQQVLIFALWKVILLGENKTYDMSIARRVLVIPQHFRKSKEINMHYCTEVSYNEKKRCYMYATLFLNKTIVTHPFLVIQCAVV